MSAMWRSKLGNTYPRDEMDRVDREHHRQLQRLRNEPGNSCCADCGRLENTWASVNLGVFLCVRCADVHRALGTHISKVKGCSGTYIWGPDELRRMEEVGNDRARAFYCCGGRAPVLSEDASKAEAMSHCQKKYEERAWCADRSGCSEPGLGAPAVPVPAVAANGNCSAISAAEDGFDAKWDAVKVAPASDRGPAKAASRRRTREPAAPVPDRQRVQGCRVVPEAAALDLDAIFDAFDAALVECSSPVFRAPLPAAEKLASSARRASPHPPALERSESTDFFAMWGDL